MASHTDLYARGWEQGMREARHILQQQGGDPAGAIHEIELAVARAQKQRRHIEGKPKKGERAFR